jgi:hypothetical protein
MFLIRIGFKHGKALTVSPEKAWSPITMESFVFLVKVDLIKERPRSFLYQAM